MSHCRFESSGGMRRVFLALGTMLVLAGWAQAQTAAPAAAPSYSSPVADFSGSMALSPALGAPPHDPLWSVDLLAGLPTGVRVQHSLGDDLGRDWLIEGFAGLDYVIFPMAGAGIRRRLTPFRGDHDALVISPGLGFYLLYDGIGWFGGGPSTVEMLALDVEVSWQHDFNERSGGQLGLRLGGGGVWGERGGFLPIVSLVFGLRF
jgi:hypothetical protein